MNHSEWFSALPQNSTMNAIVPMEWQPSLPYPMWKEEQLLLYVPYQRLWIEEGQVHCSEKLGEAWFRSGSGRLVAYTDLCTMAGADAQATLAACTLKDDAVYRSNLLVERLLLQLDTFGRQVPDTAALTAYDKLLEKALLFPQQILLYKKVMEYANHRL